LFVLIIKHGLTILISVGMSRVRIGIVQGVIAMFRLVQFWCIGIMDRCRIDRFFGNISFCREIFKEVNFLRCILSFMGFKIV